MSGAILLAASGLVVANAGPATALPACTVDYDAHEWTSAPGQGGNLPWNATLVAGGSFAIGFTGTWTGSNPPPDGFALNGLPYNDDGPGEPEPGQRVANPYQDAQVYLNPDWAQQVRAQADATPGPLGEQMAQVADYPTAVWLDDIAAITTGRGLAGHLDEALRQGADLVQLVIYNLPNRDCHGEGANGEVPVAAGGQQRYQTDYIDPIVEILSRPEYADLRLVAVVEPGALVTQVIYSPPMTGRPAVPGDVRGGCLCGGDPVRGER